jgi:hypothetical protein
MYESMNLFFMEIYSKFIARRFMVGVSIVMVVPLYRWTVYLQKGVL